MSIISGSGSLFERLDPEACEQRSLQARSNLPDKILGIKRNMEMLLNSRQGCSQSSPDAGLPDFHSSVSGSSDLLVRTARGIRESIEAHEPRVRVRDVRYLPNPDAPLELTFHLACEMTAETEAEVFGIDLVMNGHNRQYRVI